LVFDSSRRWVGKERASAKMNKVLLLLVSFQRELVVSILSLGNAIMSSRTAAWSPYPLEWVVTLEGRVGRHYMHEENTAALIFACIDFVRVDL
jgi:hypothetical protein